MKKMTAAALVGAFAMSSFATDIWDGKDGSGAVQTGGYWFKYDDNKEAASPDNGPGASTSNFPEGSMEMDVVGPWFLEKGGMADVIFTINPTTYKYPFAGIGFNWSDPEDDGKDLTGQEGVCLEYELSGDVPMAVEIKVPATVDGNNAYKMALPKQSMGKKAFKFSSFKQESGWGTITTLANVMAKSTGMKFKASLSAPPASAKTSNLKLKSVGWYATCGANAVLNTVNANSVKFSQLGRTLSFSGVQAGASVEVVNMQGQVVASQVLGSSKSVNLSKLSNGLYMVRVAGEKVNFSQRIVLQ